MTRLVKLILGKDIVTGETEGRGCEWTRHRTPLPECKKSAAEWDGALIENKTSKTVLPLS
jgi:hypothetical protein